MCLEFLISEQYLSKGIIFNFEKNMDSTVRNLYIVSKEMFILLHQKDFPNMFPSAMMQFLHSKFRFMAQF